MTPLVNLRFVPLYSLSLAACLVPGHALAQTTGSIAEESAPSVAQAPASIGGIVVAAQKRAEKLSDVPIAITAFSGDLLADIPFRDLQDFTAVVPDRIWALYEGAVMLTHQHLETLKRRAG